MLLPWRRRRRAASPEYDAADVASRWVPRWDRLRHDHREHLLTEAAAFAAHVRFEGARDVVVTDEMRLAVGASAALLTLALPDGVDSYTDVSSVIVHRTTIVRRGARPIGGGLWTDAPDRLAGEAVHRGPVVVAWDSARRHARHPEWGENVLVHEFAHRLDMLDGVVDGTPLVDPSLRDRWIEVCTEAFERVRAAPHGVRALRRYAATNPGEFFAVASESFFTVPDVLREAEPALYAVLRDFYRQDPAAA